MALDNKAREILFGTPMFARQLRKCIEDRGSIREEELREFFPDIGSNLFNQTLRQLRRQGVIQRQNGTVTYLSSAPEIQGFQADRAWRAACLLKSFSLGELCRTAEISWTYAQRLVGRWVKNGVAVKTAGSRRGAPAVWAMKTGETETRPVRNQR